LYFSKFSELATNSSESSTKEGFIWKYPIEKSEAIFPLLMYNILLEEVSIKSLNELNRMTSGNAIAMIAALSFLFNSRFIICF
jgi:hypothetical protein